LDEEPFGPQPIILNTTVFLYPVLAGFDQFVIQPHLQFVFYIAGRFVKFFMRKREDRGALAARGQL
jgi:hypothetical protein